MSTVTFVFSDGTEKELGLGSHFKGLKHNGVRPIHANINISKDIGFDVLHRVANSVYSALKKRSLYEDITIRRHNEQSASSS